MNLNKDAESWARVSPSAVSHASAANIFNVVAMAIEDIQKQAAEIERLRKGLRDVMKASNCPYDTARAALSSKENR